MEETRYIGRANLRKRLTSLDGQVGRTCYRDGSANPYAFAPAQPGLPAGCRRRLRDAGLERLAERLNYGLELDPVEYVGEEAPSRANAMAGHGPRQR